MMEKDSKKSHHLVDIRGLILSPMGKLYLGFYLGKDNRFQSDSIEHERRKNSPLLSIIFGGIFLTGAIVLSILALSVSLYALKSALGIDLLPKSPMQTILETLRVCHSMKPQP